MDFDDLMIQLEEELFPSTITRVVDTGECFVVFVCGPDGYPPLQMPYAVSQDGKITAYDLSDEELKRKHDEGRVLYTDYSPLKVKLPDAL